MASSPLARRAQRGISAAACRSMPQLSTATQVFEVLTAMPPVGGKPGPPRQRPQRLQGDRGYDSGPVRQVLRWLGIIPVLAARYTEQGSGLGVLRWFLERTVAWLHSFGRLRRRLGGKRRRPEAAAPGDGCRGDRGPDEFPARHPARHAEMLHVLRQVEAASRAEQRLPQVAEGRDAGRHVLHGEILDADALLDFLPADRRRDGRLRPRPH